MAEIIWYKKKQRYLVTKKRRVFMAGLVKENFEEEVLVELSWIMNAIDELSSKLEVETYEIALIRYRIQPEEENAIHEFFLYNFREIRDLKIGEIQEGIGKIFYEKTNKKWSVENDIVNKLIDLKIEQLKL